MAALQAAAGLAALLALGVLTASALYLLGLWRDTLHPPRRTMAWALAYGQTAHPEDLGYVTLEQSFPRVDGSATPCWIVTGALPTSGLITILLHGHGRSRWDSLRRIAPWVSRSALVVLPDLRGHGEAPGLTSLGRQEVRDIVLLMNELAVVYPGSRFILAGHSMGAVIAIHAAAHVADSGPPVELVEAFGPYETVRTPLNARLEARGLPRGPYPVVLLGLVRLLHGREVRTSEVAVGVTSTMIIHADHDDLVSPAVEAQIIARAAPNARAELTRGVPHADLGVPAPPVPTAPTAGSAVAATPQNPASARTG